MKLAFSTLGCPEWSWKDIVSSASDLGYDGFEVRGLQNELYAPDMQQFRPENMEKYKAELQRLGLAIPCLTSACLLGQREGYAQTISEGRAYVDVAARMGIPYIRVMCETTPGPEVPVDDGLAREGLQELAQYAQDKGVTVLMETSGYYAASERIAALLKAVDSPAAGILWDVHHPYRFFHEQPTYTANLIAPWVRYIHMKDSVVQADGHIRYKMLFHGDLPLDDILQCLAGIGYKGWYSLEWTRRWNLELEEPGIAFAQYIRRMKQYAQAHGE